jgi:hypothetical protein
LFQSSSLSSVIFPRLFRILTQPYFRAQFGVQPVLKELDAVLKGIWPGIQRGIFPVLPPSERHLNPPHQPRRHFGNITRNQRYAGKDSIIRKNGIGLISRLRCHAPAKAHGHN